MKNTIFSATLIISEIIIYYLLGALLEIPQRVCIQTMLVYLILMTGGKHYIRKTVLIWDEIKKNFRVVLLHMSITAVYIVNIFDGTELIKILILSASMFFVATTVNRMIRILFRNYFGYKTIVIGDGWATNRYIDIADNNRFSLVEVKGIVSLKQSEELIADEHAHVDGVQSIRRYGFDRLEDAIFKSNADQIVILTKSGEGEQFEKVMRIANKKNIRVQSLVRSGGMITFASIIQDFDGLLLCTNSSNPMGIGAGIIKRLIDIAAGITGCVLSAVLYFKIRKSYKTDGDMGPAIFTQQRIGKNGKPIKIYKFRTMVENAEQVLEELMERDPVIKEEYRLNKKLENDPRVTKMGDKLRKTSLDEFPQFWNVLKGEMSLVGPRPYLYREKEDMGEYYDAIIECKPGVTGMWQANGRSDVSFEERCRFDEYYYKNWSLTMEFIIVYKTIKGVIYGKGAM